MAEPRGVAEAMSDLKYKRFWLVWNPSGRAPSCKHWSEDAAITEAESLAKSNPNYAFIVLEAKCGRTVREMIKMDFDDSTIDLPF